MRTRDRSLRRICVPWSTFVRAIPIRFLRPREEDIKRSVEHEVENLAVRIGAPDIQAVRRAVENSVREHWSVDSVLSHNMDIDELVERVNSWTGKSSGPAIADWVALSDCVEFHLSQPFLAVEKAARECAKMNSDDKFIRDLTDLDVAITIRNVLLCTGATIELDLSDWDSERQPISFGQAQGYQLDKPSPA